MFQLPGVYLLLLSFLMQLQTQESVITKRESSSQTTVSADVSGVAHKALPAIVSILAYDGEGKLISQGSGVLVSADGKVVTNYHVIEKTRSVVIKFSDGAFYDVQNVISSVPEADLAILKIRATREFPFLRLADSSRVEIGQEVVAIGSPMALEGTVSTGIISSIRKTEDIFPGRLSDETVLQITTPVSPGSSGGALLNLDGDVVGIPSFGYVRGQNLNFAIPSNEVTALLLKPNRNQEGNDAIQKSFLRPKQPSSPSEILRSAKTLYISLRSGNPVLKTEFSSKIMEWGKLALVSSPESADLILEITQTGELNMGTGAGNQATALLTGRESGLELWSKTKGGSWSMRGWSNSAVAHGLASDFIKFMEHTNINDKR